MSTIKRMALASAVSMSLLSSVSFAAVSGEMQGAANAQAQAITKAVNVSKATIQCKQATLRIASAAKAKGGKLKGAELRTSIMEATSNAASKFGIEAGCITPSNVASAASRLTGMYPATGPSMGLAKASGAAAAVSGAASGLGGMGGLGALAGLVGIAAVVAIANDDDDDAVVTTTTGTATVNGVAATTATTVTTQPNGETTTVVVATDPVSGNVLEQVTTIRTVDANGNVRVTRVTRRFLNGVPQAETTEVSVFEADGTTQIGAPTTSTVSVTT